MVPSALLNRDLAVAQTSELRALGGPLLKEVVDQAAGVFARCSQTAPDGDHNLGVLMPLHLAIEMLDAVHVLLKESCVVGARPALRTAWEASLAVKYVVEEDTERRGLAYVVGDVMDRLRWYEEMDPGTSRGQAFRETMGVTEDSDYPFPEEEERLRGEESLHRMLDRQPFAPVRDEYLRLRKERRGPPHWYSLFGGPPNLRELAKAVGDVGDYLVIYRPFSKTAHAVDTNRQLEAAGDGPRAAVSVIRAPFGMADNYRLACTIGVQVASEALRHYRPGEAEGFARWFLADVDPRLEVLGEAGEERA